MLPYELTARAARDFEAAAEWYEGQKEGLAREFIDAVVQAIGVARDRPLSCPEIQHGVRGVRCARFPYRIHFEVSADRISVTAIYHTSRDPQRWSNLERE